MNNKLHFLVLYSGHGEHSSYPTLQDAIDSIYDEYDGTLNSDFEAIYKIDLVRNKSGRVFSVEDAVEYLAQDTDLKSNRLTLAQMGLTC